MIQSTRLITKTRSNQVVGDGDSRILSEKNASVSTGKKESTINEIKNTNTKLDELELGKKSPPRTTTAKIIIIEDPGTRIDVDADSLFSKTAQR